jgi:hypothetical protein
MGNFDPKKITGRCRFDQLILCKIRYGSSRCGPGVKMALYLNVSGVICKRKKAANLG